MNPDATVGIVLVSHSAALAEGAADPASEVAGGPEGVAVVPAGGTDDGGLGTSEAKVADAIKRADRGAGVLIIPDLGSAVLPVRPLLAAPEALPGQLDPAGQLAVAAAKFTADISLTAGDKTANAKSVLAVMGLGATSGQNVTASAVGPDCEQAVPAVVAILADATKVGG